jgi:hypothetical protein
MDTTLGDANFSICSLPNSTGATTNVKTKGVLWIRSYISNLFYGDIVKSLGGFCVYLKESSGGDLKCALSKSLFQTLFTKDMLDGQ